MKTQPPSYVEKGDNPNSILFKNKNKKILYVLFYFFWSVKPTKTHFQRFFLGLGAGGGNVLNSIRYSYSAIFFSESLFCPSSCLRLPSTSRELSGTFGSAPIHPGALLTKLDLNKVLYVVIGGFDFLIFFRSSNSFGSPIGTFYSHSSSTLMFLKL